ncbi:MULTISPECIES: PP2C family serine/threonine-protein phosphatase [Pseudomonas]|jgi:serine/threonine-protein phosphatase Stp1|uniref:Serine/threonine-protein phosphatase Stp1 n=1 Tax=Pseudomonas putida TaxID=303 RepID=A0A9X8EKZ6_PSEPU|nr:MULTISPECIES: PP2C family serine/threonine-protein phosphatase [Pseudomonas]KTC24012.1 protein phosphatase [Pseudomonas putida]MCO7507305.1 serine/threonine-protein phosphatase [Pseudomonas sp. VE 267-6A]MCO7532556.1 serine/threonine-protein phosphatase [Pseudomonas sp. 2]MCQ0170217.1 serine/threonine-protein phosphatase [Pseudomonas sp. S12(2018)]MCS5514826.1 serine/threonine-protein phosphatase [Pseudomonas qingdaonensis]
MQVGARWRSAARTDAGKVRMRNEDAFLECPAQGLWAVADGMGGYRSGDLASQLIVASLAELPAHGSFDERLEGVRGCLHWINRRLGQELTVTDAHHDSIMGSTVVALLLEGERAACIWAGDSRCYLWRQQRLYQLSRDHSLQQQLIDQRQMSAEQARAQPGARALTRALGASEQLTLEVLELQVYPGDAFLLCSDGLYQELSSDALGKALSLASAQVALERLFEGALRGAAGDNLTAVVIRQ